MNVGLEWLSCSLMIFIGMLVFSRIEVWVWRRLCECGGVGWWLLGGFSIG